MQKLLNNLFGKNPGRDSLLGALGIILFIMFVSGFFLLKSNKTHADMFIENSDEVVDSALNSPEAPTLDGAVTSQCSVYIPEGSNWDLERLQVAAAKYGCEVKEFFFGH